ncbi:hypothetical protein DFH09DRAFT_1361807 [Mycena vulgaris]|nr:hypothetical protein DFH09DRAFT_1361807 [Mycena vulgaris]
MTLFRAVYATDDPRGSRAGRANVHRAYSRSPSQCTRRGRDERRRHVDAQHDIADQGAGIGAQKKPARGAGVLGIEMRSLARCPAQCCGEDLPAAPARLRLFPAATLALTLLAALLVLTMVHAAFAARRRLVLPLSAKPISVQVQEKSASKSAPKPASSWLPLHLSWETLPPPPVSSASSHVPRAGPVRHPEPALATRPRVEAPLPAIYASPTPVSMAKMIMNRHTYRRPCPSLSRASPSASSRRARTPPTTVSRERVAAFSSRHLMAPSRPALLPSGLRSEARSPPHLASGSAPPRVPELPRAPQIQHLRPPAMCGSLALSRSRGSVAASRPFRSASASVSVPRRYVISPRRWLESAERTTLRLDGEAHI